MERHPIRNTLLTLGLTATIAGEVALRPDQHLMSAEDWQFREQILSSRPFTPEAVRYLKTIPLFNRHITEQGGGGYYFSGTLFGNYEEVFSNQEEAAVHEMSHAFFDYLTAQDPTFATNFMNAEAQMVAQDKDYGYFKTLEFGFGDKWKGIDHSDVTEWYASTASKIMGKDEGEFPDALKPFYKYEFIIPGHLDRSFPVQDTPLPISPTPIWKDNQK